MSISVSKSILRRRMAAEGISFTQMKEVLMSALRARMETRSFGETFPNTEIEQEELVSLLSDATRFGGGYLYPGDSLTIDEQDATEEIPLLTTNNCLEKEEIKAFCQFLEREIPQAQKVELTISLKYYDTWEYIRKDNNIWILTHKYCGEMEVWERKNPLTHWMYRDIRKDVAECLEVEMSPTFHAAFNQAVEALTYDYYRLS